VTSAGEAEAQVGQSQNNWFTGPRNYHRSGPKAFSSSFFVRAPVSHCWRWIVLVFSCAKRC